MPETEEERQLRREKKKREAARKAAEAERMSGANITEAVPPPRDPANTAATMGRTPADNPEATVSAGDAHVTRKETEEERRIRKEKKRAQREARREQEAAAAATAGVSPSMTDSTTPKAKPSREERRAARERERQISANMGGDVDGGQYVKKNAERGSDAALLHAIEEENRAVMTQSATSSRNFAESELKRAEEEHEQKKRASAGQRAERRRAEKEERHRLRNADAAGKGQGNTEERLGGSAAGAASEKMRSNSEIAFDSSGLQRQAYRLQFQRDLARAMALRRMVDFDSSSGVVLDLAPQTAYDLYIRDFGQSGREQAGVQAPPEEERLDAGTQAERGKLRARGAQAPDDLGLCPEEESERQFFQLRRNSMLRGGAAAGTGARYADGGGDRGGDGEGGGGGVAGKAAEDAVSKKKTRSVDASLLERFLTRTLPVMSAVLDENNATASGAAAAASAAAGDSPKTRASTAFSSSYITFCWHGTRNRPVVQVLLNPSNPRQIFALHGAAVETGPSQTLDTFLSVLLLWSVHDAAAPERVLTSFSPITCMCISPSRPYLLYGGTAEGNVCVWNLREPDRLHLAAGRYGSVIFCLPSYTTGWQVGGHTAPVRQVRVAGYNSPSSATRKEEQYEQLVSMDDTGLMCYWALREKHDPFEMSGGSPATAAVSGFSLQDTDYGLHPGSGVSLHLVKGSTAAAAVTSSAVRQQDEDSHSAVIYSAGLAGGFDFLPSDSSQCVLTAPQGIVRCTRFGGTPSPSLYGPFGRSGSLPYAVSSREGHGCVKVVAVPCCVQYNIVDPRWFVAGYEDGTVRLYLQHTATPQVTVEVCDHPIVAVRCSGSIPWVVWALDESGQLHLIDFAYHRRQEPRLSHTLTQPDTGRCTCIDLSSKDEKADQNFLVAGFENGSFQVHTVGVEKLRVANSERDEKWI
ncbi:hypothetical protein JKF63_06625 [Porcisia hertigi]|uniref:Uncharacterized protein n=1 Tax=Porcisia hertigi TaxID=2761500 RepID=A0A836IAE6_9TRYP|nr:hypothetical protein JKF63_06625 [Porcisia hertigi]